MVSQILDQIELAIWNDYLVKMQSPYDQVTVDYYLTHHLKVQNQLINIKFNIATTLSAELLDSISLDTAWTVGGFT